MNLKVERSQYQTLLGDVPSLLSYEDNIWPCKIIDISLNGCLLCFNNTWERQNIEAIYTLTIQAPTSKPVIMNLSISHVIDNEVSFKCEHIDKQHSLLLHQLAGSKSLASKLLARELLELSHPIIVSSI